MIDVYKGRTKAETNLFRYALFISFFPQLVAGPIERSNRLLRQLAEPHDFDFRRARDGLLIMLLGFFEKVVIADRAAIYVNAIFGNWVESSGAQIALATAVFAVQDLCDFAGYSYIAIGTAKVRTRSPISGRAGTSASARGSAITFMCRSARDAGAKSARHST